MSCDRIRWPLTAHADWMTLFRARPLRHTCLFYLENPSNNVQKSIPRFVWIFPYLIWFQMCINYWRFVLGNKQLDVNPKQRWHFKTTCIQKRVGRKRVTNVLHILLRIRLKISGQLLCLQVFGNRPGENPMRTVCWRDNQKRQAFPNRGLDHTGSERKLDLPTTWAKTINRWLHSGSRPKIRPRFCWCIPKM